MSTGDNEERVTPGVLAAHANSFALRRGMSPPMTGPRPAKVTPWRPAPRLGRGAPPTPPTFPSPAPARQQPKLLDRLREALLSRHYSRRTERAYCYWVKRFNFFHNVRHPAEMAEPEINAFLTHKPRHLPVVMTREEVKAVLRCLDGDKRLMASLMYGAGLRLMECLRLRVQDIDFARNEITIRDGKGAKDRVTMLPESVKTALQEHLRLVKTIHEQDLRDGWGLVQMPNALDRKYPNASAEWRWQWVFPQENRWRNATTRQEGRHHVDESLVQRAVKDTVRKAGIVRRATCHTFRHSGVYPALCGTTHVLEAGYDIRAVQELLGHQDVRTTMIYTHVLNRGGKGVRSPADAL